MNTTDKLAEALREAAQSLETIARNAGKAIDTDGQENCLRHFDQVRGYANSRAAVARAALEAKPVPAEPVAWRVDAGYFTKYESIPASLRESAVPLYAAPAAPAPVPLTDEPAAWINWSALTGEPRLGWQCESEIASEPLYRKAKP
jgi:hypothetical protein